VNAIEVSGVTKQYALAHARRTTLREYFQHPFQRTRFTTMDALADVSFEVREGEFFGVIGANGSGKSTLLKILAGIYRPTRGHVRVRGRVSPFIELGVGFHGGLSARDNIRINATLLGLGPRDIRRKLPEILEFAELEEFVDQKLKNYSSGMQVRLAYSIAIQVPFDVLLLDEVLAVGDEAFQVKCFETFRTFRAEGRTIVLVSHDLTAIGTQCDRALLLDHGVIADIGEPGDVVRDYLELVTVP
jgi:ABC-type polysaccharide/polyol phosphate transport system ATPase subunit